MTSTYIVNTLIKCLSMRNMNGGLNITDIISYLTVSIEEESIKDYLDILLSIDTELKQKKQ